MSLSLGMVQLAAGDYPLELITFYGGGTASTEFFAVPDFVEMFDVDVFQLLTTNPSRIDLDRPAGLRLVGELPSSAWNVDMDGNWSAVGNWTLDVPNGAGVKAVFGGVNTQSRSVSVDADVAVGHIDFNSANGYTIDGPNTLTLDVTSGDAQIRVLRGNHIISAPLVLADDTVFTVSPPSSHLFITGELSGGGVSLTKAGAGTLTVNHVRAMRYR